MISRNQLKHLHALRLKKFRDEESAFVAEGIKLVDDLLDSDFRVLSVYATASWFRERKDVIGTHPALFQEISEEELQRASNLATANEVIAVVSIPEQMLPEPPEFGQILLMLDRIQDPGNLGTIIRTADWFGIRHILCSPETADVYNPKVVQSTMGSICRVKVHYLDLLDFQNKKLSEWHLYAADARAGNIYTTSLDFPAAILIGNESQGISGALMDKVSKKIAIPSNSRGAESLNASVAAGIICSEFFRRLNFRV